MNRKPNVIDLFAGAGGLSHGFKLAGYNIVMANEIDSAIADSYRRNNPATLMLNVDIKHLVNDFEGVINRSDTSKFPHLREQLDNIDVIIGGPPCQGWPEVVSAKQMNLLKMSEIFCLNTIFKSSENLNPNFLCLRM